MLISKRVFLASLFTLSTAVSPWALADTGPGGTGGGDLVGNDLLDFVENREMKEIDPTQLPVYRTEVISILRKAAKLSPEFASELAHGLVDTPWNFDTSELAGIEDNTGIVKTKNGRRVAFQNQFHVRINENLFNQVSDTVRGQILVHELVRRMAIKKGNVSEYSIREMTRTLFSDPIARSPEELKHKLAEHGFGNYQTTDEFNVALNSTKEVISKVCGVNKDELANGLYTTGAVDSELMLSIKSKWNAHWDVRPGTIDFDNLKDSRAFAYDQERIERISSSRRSALLLQMRGADHRKSDVGEVAEALQRSCSDLRALTAGVRDEVAAVRMGGEVTRSIASLGNANHSPSSVTDKSTKDVDNSSAIDSSPAAVQMEAGSAR